MHKARRKIGRVHEDMHWFYKHRLPKTRSDPLEAHQKGRMISQYANQTTAHGILHLKWVCSSIVKRITGSIGMLKLSSIKQIKLWVITRNPNVAPSLWLPCSALESPCGYFPTLYLRSLTSRGTPWGCSAPPAWPGDRLSSDSPPELCAVSTTQWIRGSSPIFASTGTALWMISYRKSGARVSRLAIFQGTPVIFDTLSGTSCWLRWFSCIPGTLWTGPDSIESRDSHSPFRGWYWVSGKHISWECPWEAGTPWESPGDFGWSCKWTCRGGSGSGIRMLATSPPLRSSQFSGWGLP